MKLPIFLYRFIQTDDVRMYLKHQSLIWLLWIEKMIKIRWKEYKHIPCFVVPHIQCSHNSLFCKTDPHGMTPHQTYISVLTVCYSSEINCRCAFHSLSSSHSLTYTLGRKINYQQQKIVHEHSLDIFISWFFIQFGVLGTCASEDNYGFNYGLNFESNSNP